MPAARMTSFANAFAPSIRAPPAGEPLHVVGAHGDELRHPGDPRIARRAVERADSGALRDLPGEGMLAAARADEEDAHGVALISCVAAPAPGLGPRTSPPPAP